MVPHHSPYPACRASNPQGLLPELADGSLGSVRSTCSVRPQIIQNDGHPSLACNLGHFWWHVHHFYLHQGLGKANLVEPTAEQTDHPPTCHGRKHGRHLVLDIDLQGSTPYDLAMATLHCPALPPSCPQCHGRRCIPHPCCICPRAQIEESHGNCWG